MKQNEIIEKCQITDSKGCLRCEDGYYINDRDCYSCPQNCFTCYNPSYCLFFSAFGITENDGMYVAPEDRVKVW